MCMNKITHLYLTVLKVSAALLLAAMVVLVFGNVVMRYVMNSGITISEELSRWIFVWMVFLGAVIGMKERAHIRLEAIVKRLNPRAQFFCDALSHVLMLIITALIIEGSWKQMVINANIFSSSSGLPQSILYAAGVTFGVMTFLILMGDLIQILRGKVAYSTVAQDTQKQADSQASKQTT